MTDVPVGYKQTEVGIIPNDWEIKSLEKICTNNGIVRGPFGGALKKEIFVKRGYKVYEQGNAIRGDVNYGTYYITEEKYNSMKRFAVEPGDYIVSCSGTIGKIFKIPDDYEKGIINQALLKLTINDNVIYPQYFYKYFSRDYFNNTIIDDTQGNAIKNLVGMDIFRATPFALPPTMEEQQAIATTLSDMDELISNLDELIEKKKNIKKGAMQKLLSSKEGWIETTLGGVCPFQRGQMLTSDNFVYGDIPVIAGGKTPAGYHNKANRKGTTITISGSGANAGYVNIYREPIFATDCFTVSEGKSYDINFIYYLLLSRQVEIYGLQTGGAQPHVHPCDIEPMEVSVPPTVEEQQAIASILSDMDKEIKALEEKKTKYESIKQGAMQKLLTGKIRLV